MVRTRGDGSQANRVRPTASIRRKERGGASNIVEDDIAEENVVVKETHVVDDEAYPGGLASYEDHVARQLWNGVDRGELKLVSHVRKMNKLRAPYERIEVVVELSDLAGLIHASYNTANKGLFSAFVERCHPNTNSFHLPIGELTITLDDVSNLLHLPIVKQFYTYATLDAVRAMKWLVEALRVDHAVAASETRECKGGHVRLSWLIEVYEDACGNKQWIVAARAYQLHLIGCTIFANKNVTSVSVSYLGLFLDLCLTGDNSQTEHPTVVKTRHLLFMVRTLAEHDCPP